MPPSWKWVAAFLALGLLLVPPAHAWYKQSAAPSYYSVGRASGLLSGVRRSPYARRSEPALDRGDAGSRSGLSEPRTSLRNLAAVCVKGITPNLRSCEPLPGALGTFQCEAGVLLALDPADCPRT